MATQTETMNRPLRASERIELKRALRLNNVPVSNDATDGELERLGLLVSVRDRAMSALCKIERELQGNNVTLHHGDVVRLRGFVREVLK